MKMGMILNLKRFKLLDYVTYNKIVIILSLLYITGIFISVFALSDNNNIFNIANTHLDNYISLHNSTIFFHKFIKRFLIYFIVLLLYFISGTSMFGVAITPFFTLWQGIFFGAISSILYSTHGISGIAFNAIIIIPTTVIFIITCFFAAKYAIDFSLSFAKLSLPYSKPTNLYNNFKKYCLNYLVLLAICFICTLIEIVLNILFLKFFNF